MDPPQQVYQSEDRYHELVGEYAANIKDRASCKQNVVRCLQL